MQPDRPGHRGRRDFVLGIDLGVDLDCVVEGRGPAPSGHILALFRWMISKFSLKVIPLARGLFDERSLGIVSVQHHCGRIM